VRAATDPLSVLDDMKHGTLSKEAVDAVKELYPKLYEDMQRKVLAHLADPKKRKAMSYEDRIRVGMLLDVQADRTQDPAFISAVQETHAQEARPPPERAAGGGGAATVLAQQTQTTSERIEAK